MIACRVLKTLVRTFVILIKCNQALAGPDDFLSFIFPRGTSGQPLAGQCSSGKRGAAGGQRSEEVGACAERTAGERK